MSGTQGAETQRLLGDLVASVRGMDSKIDDARQDRKESEERMRGEFSKIQDAMHLQRNRELVISARLEVVEANQKVYEAGQNATRVQIDAIRTQVDSFRGPVDELISNRRLNKAFWVAAASMLFVIINFVQPMVANFVSHAFGWKP